jgi:RNA ligase (TIGR02306 family)
MSDLIVTIKEIKKLLPHPNADNLELVIVDGWQCVVAKETYKEGDLVLHIPPDALLPWEIADKWGVARYLSGYEKREKPDAQGNFSTAGRVKAVRLRQEISHGCVIPNEGNYKPGDDLASVYGIVKYEPPEDMSWNQGNMEKPNVNLYPYSDVQNERNFSQVFESEESVIALEKIHGTNSVIGCVIQEGIEGTPYEIMISSRKNRRKMGEGSLYEQPLLITPAFEQMLKNMYAHYTVDEIAPRSVIVYSEIFGHVQKHFDYGHPDGYNYACFDISVNGKYLNWDEVVKWCSAYGVNLVPEVYRGPYNEAKMWELSKGNTLMPMEKPHLREGIVVKCLNERMDVKIGRVILKFVSDDYLDFSSRKGGTDYH